MQAVQVDEGALPLMFPQGSVCWITATDLVKVLDATIYLITRDLICVYWAGLAVRDWDYISDWGPGVIENTWTGTTGVQPDASDMPPPPPPIHSSSAQPSDSTPVSPASQVNPNAGYPSELQASQHKYHDPPPVSPRSSVDNQLTRRWSIYDLPWDTSTVDKLYGSGAGIRPSPPPYPPSSQVQSDSLNSKGAT
ncbi:hypothetical protein K474DRAFT_1676580 [Panus rudis PR-1116 ss-1]|nr:hypothetical protein K474DRAFT_1676580 [Panus rudis PR-1116 ss-1]